MTAKHLVSLACVLALLALPACGARDEALGRVTRSDSLAVRALLASEIARRDSVDTSTFRLGPIRTEGLSIVHTPSSVVPRIRYVWGSYCVPNAYPCLGDAIVAVDRGDSTRLIRGTADWAWAVGTWRPRSTGAAIDACEEIVRTARPDVSFYGQPLVLSSRTGFEPRGDSAWRAFMDSTMWPPARIDTLQLQQRPYLVQLPLSETDEARVRARRRDLHEPRAMREGDTWRVVIWTIREVELARYRCTFEVRQGAKHTWVHLAKEDSTRLDGWPRE